MEMEFELSGHDGEVLVVRLPRDLTHESAESLRQTVARRLPNREDAGVVLAMAAVELISSIGIAALLQVRELCEDRRAPLILAAMPDRQVGFLRMLKLDRKFAFAPTVDDAVAQASGGLGRA